MTALLLEEAKNAQGMEDARSEDEIEYPESDGEPMAENSVQFDWILLLAGNLKALFRDNANVYVSGNQNWYPRYKEPKVVNAPDVYVVFGRPKGDRKSWKQWQENDVPMTVVFEILSPKNSIWEMARKLAFYDVHGAEEYYVYNPETNGLLRYLRGQALLRLVCIDESFSSPRLGIRFDLSGSPMRVLFPDGRPFLPLEDVDAERLREHLRANKEQQRAEKEQQRADKEQQRAEKEQQRAEKEQQRAEKEQQRAEKEQQRAEKEQQRADKEQQRAARLAELARKARRGQASVEELTELDRLEIEIDSKI